ncbi:hypothetical protein Acr_19g0003880 [Actinidia rufa]|uniref:Uncharacterized protein n=1 Tax=Actinidia rufa TaxID=165716 RepID=A0A7J0G9M3_9ERIC|nr:hypothetical protein Acr_19g0003880 [Actinidia rufa]
MAKQAIALVALLALGHASTLRTINTTITVEENWGMQRFHEQIQRQQLRHCQMYLSERMPFRLSLGNVQNPQPQQSLRQCPQQSLLVQN